MKNYYCWRCKTIIPFLDEKEWEVIDPILSDQIALIKDLRKKEKIDIAEAQSRA